MSAARDTQAGRAEEFLWSRYRRALERAGQGEAAMQLRHLAQARQTGVHEQNGFNTISFDLYLRTSDYSVKLNAEDGVLLGWYFDLLAEDGGNTISAPDAQRAAEQAAEPPADAVLAYARYEEVAGRPIFVAHWNHVVQGVPVERDYIHVYVNGKSGRVFGLFRKWHVVDSTFGPR